MCVLQVRHPHDLHEENRRLKHELDSLRRKVVEVDSSILRHDYVPRQGLTDTVLHALLPVCTLLTGVCCDCLHCVCVSGASALAADPSSNL